MILTLDTDKQTLRVETPAAKAREMPLYSAEAFELLSDQWVNAGWALGYYHTFSWAGLPVLQLPEDLIRLQEVIQEISPEVIIETGIFHGGSILYHATLCEAAGKGRVIGIDLQVPPETRHAIESHRLAHRIELIEGSSIAPEILSRVRKSVEGRAPVLVILDSDHSKAHVAAELAAYAPLVTSGSWLIATDGIMRDLAGVPGGSAEWANDNPAAAAREFAATHPEFAWGPPAWPVNRSKLSRNVTYWPDAWLRRIA